jgi:hypothetical protein
MTLYYPLMLGKVCAALLLLGVAAISECLGLGESDAWTEPFDQLGSPARSRAVAEY